MFFIFSIFISFLTILRSSHFLKFFSFVQVEGHARYGRDTDQQTNVNLVTITDMLSSYKTCSDNVATLESHSE